MRITISLDQFEFGVSYCETGTGSCGKWRAVRSDFGSSGSRRSGTSCSNPGCGKTRRSCHT
jgi:hypothetical protein